MRTGDIGFWDCPEFYACTGIECVPAIVAGYILESVWIGLQQHLPDIVDALGMPTLRAVIIHLTHFLRVTVYLVTIGDIECHGSLTFLPLDVTAGSLLLAEYSCGDLIEIAHHLGVRTGYAPS